ncbi:MAG: BPSS1780 family membrane protein [Nitrosomonas sp.]|nr:BPSS1780 family membrane protein [Nitrosomonas sp.]
MEIHQLNAKHGWQWIMSGFYLFRKAPLVWVLSCFTMLLIAVTLAIMPLLGQFIFTLISPVFLAGLMYGCRELDQGRELELVHLFAAFKTNATPLITIGGIYLIGQVLIVGVVMMIGGSMMADMLLYGKRVDDSELMGAMDSMLTASLVAITLSIPLMMAAWFSPLLVIFHDIPPIIAMQRSFFACLKNFIPFQLYGITLFILAIIALMPYGAGLVILIPTVFASIYASYKEIFLGEKLNTKEEISPDSYQKATWSNVDEQPIEDTKGKENSAHINNDNTGNKEADKVQCTYCGTHLPKEEAIHVKNRYFCNEEHYQLYQSSEN